MATGRLGANNLAATTNTTVYTVPSATYAVMTISICNTNAAAIKTRIAVCESATPSTREYIEYDVSIPGNEAFERTGVVADENKQVVVYSDTSAVAAVVYGIER